eukprot:g27853.t1
MAQFAWQEVVHDEQLVVEPAESPIRSAKTFDIATASRASKASFMSTGSNPLDLDSDSSDEQPNEQEVARMSRIQAFFLSSSFESMVAILLFINICVMAMQLQFLGLQNGYNIGIERYSTPPDQAWPYADTVFFICDITFAALFTLEMMIRQFYLRLTFFKYFLNWLDFLVVCSSWIELFAAGLPINPTFLRMLRLGKLLRAIRVVRMSQVLESLQLLLKCIAASVKILFWSLFLLMIIQISAGMSISYLVSEYLVDPTVDIKNREAVFRYYGSFTKTLLTMFEVLFANWAPPCRVLIDNVSEWYALVFVIYRCFVNAVFVQSTMKARGADVLHTCFLFRWTQVAQADEEFILLEKKKAEQAYRRKAQEQMISQLQLEGAKLEEDLQQIRAARSRGPGSADVEDRVREERLNEKGALINKLQEELGVEMSRMEQGGHLKEEIHAYEAQRAALKLEIQQAKATRDQGEAGFLRDEANMRIAAMEAMVRGKTAEHQGEVDEHLKAQQARLLMVQEKQRLQSRCLDLKQRNEQLAIEIEAQHSEMQKVEREMRLMRLQRPEGTAVPSVEELQSTGSMARVIERLEGERDDLRRQVAVLRMDLERESQVSKNFKALQAQELEDARSKSQMNDQILEQMEGHLRVEVHGSLPGSETQRLLGLGVLPMANLLHYGMQDTRNPVGGGVVAIKDPNDEDILVAKLRIKLRMRYSMEELAEDFITRARVRQQDRGGKSTKTDRRKSLK